MNRNIRESLDLLLNTLGDNYNDIDEFVDLTDKVKACQRGPEKPKWELALIGETGIGKSTALNALLRRLGLSRTSSGTRSCTQFAITYECKDGAPDDTKKSDVTLRFLSNVKREETILSHIEHYARVYHFDDNHDEDDESEDDDVGYSITQTERNLAEEALGLFRVSFDVYKNKKAAKRLAELLKDRENFQNGVLLRACLNEQQARLRELEAGQDDTVTFSDVPDQRGPEDGSDVLDIAAVLMLAEDVWPLVKIVTIATGSILIRYGVVLTDIPGKPVFQHTSVLS